MSRTAIIIPARLASSRFPGKPLAPLAGPDGRSRPLIEWTWAAARAAAAVLPGNTLCVVATDSACIADHARAAGIDVVMTPDYCANGTERCAAALTALPADVGMVINFQGDAPLIPPAMVAAVVDKLAGDPKMAMATAVVPATPAVMAHLSADAAAGRVGGTTAVVSRDGRALYFSKSIIPHVAPGNQPVLPVLLHVGLYAYRPVALAAYATAGPAPLEVQEGLEQLRFLDAGLPVGVAVCPPPAWELIEVNNIHDVPLVEAQLAVRAATEAG